MKRVGQYAAATNFAAVAAAAAVVVVVAAAAAVVVVVAAVVNQQCSVMKRRDCCHTWALCAYTVTNLTMVSHESLPQERQNSPPHLAAVVDSLLTDALCLV